MQFLQAGSLHLCELKYLQKLAAVHLFIGMKTNCSCLAVSGGGDLWSYNNRSRYDYIKRLAKSDLK